MKPAVDLANLIEMIGDDPNMQKDLFAEFMRAFESGYADMQKNSATGGEEIWRTQAHALKGISFNLGAMELGGLCKTAQDSKEAPSAEKQSQLSAIGNEYRLVKEFLQNHMRHL
jgi:HPt (histidine-containing phosphotransfer) domain-containing protein